MEYDQDPRVPKGATTTTTARTTEFVKARVPGRIMKWEEKDDTERRCQACARADQRMRGGGVGAEKTTTAMPATITPLAK